MAVVVPVYPHSPIPTHACGVAAAPGEEMPNNRLRTPFADENATPEMEEWAGGVAGEHPYHTYPDRSYLRHTFQARESAAGRIWKECRYHYFPQKETRKEEGAGAAAEVAGVDRRYSYLWE